MRVSKVDKEMAQTFLAFANGAGGPPVYAYTTPLAALADGWKLLAHPKDTGPVEVTLEKGGAETRYPHDWWFVRDVVTDTPRPGVS